MVGLSTERFGSLNLKSGSGALYLTVMREEQQDIFKYIGRADIMCIPTNGTIKQSDGEAVMGAGVARQFANRYPDLPRVLAAKLQQGNVIHYLGSYSGTAFLSFPTKHNWYDRKADLFLIKEAGIGLLNTVNLKVMPAMPNPLIVLPRVGCGCGRLSWEQEVRPFLAAILDDRFLVVHT